MNIGNRIKKERVSIGLTQEQVASKVGVTKQTIQKYENGIISNIPSDKIELIAAALNVSPNFLMGWEYEYPELFSIPGIEPLPIMKRIPRLGSIACGEPILAEQNLDGMDLVEEAVDCDFSLICKGDSMVNARINDGDVVYIKRQSTVDNGEIAAVLIGNEATLKRVYLSSNKLVLQPENSEYAPMVFVAEELSNVRILGKAVCFKSRVV